jgi:hypothetical protein
MNRRSYLFTLVLLISFLAACSSTTSLPTTSTPTPGVTATSTPTSRPVSTALIGMYTATITRKDIASVDLARNALSGSDVQPGTWILTFRDDGYYTTLGGNYPLGISYIGAGPYSVTQNQLVLNDAKCEEFYQDGRTGIYSWSLQRDMLTLKPVFDMCTARILVMASHPWKRQS